jgi:hypothetical protein
VGIVAQHEFRTQDARDREMILVGACPAGAGPFKVMLRPTMFGSKLNRRFQNSWLRTTAAAGPGLVVPRQQKAAIKRFRSQQMEQRG